MVMLEVENERPFIPFAFPDLNFPCDEVLIHDPEKAYPKYIYW